MTITARAQAKVKASGDTESILGDCGDHVFIENPVHISYGNHVHLSEHFYANFNLVIVDDVEVFIGDHVMIGPNVTLCTTGHPVYPRYREMVAHYSLPIHISRMCGSAPTR